MLVATAACVLGLGAWASGAFHLASEPPVRSQAVARPLEMFRYAPSPWRTPQPVEMFRHTPRAPAIAQVPDAAPPLEVLRSAIAHLWGAETRTTLPLAR